MKTLFPTQSYFLIFCITLLFSLGATAQKGPAGVGSTTNNRIWIDAKALELADGTGLSMWPDISGNGVVFSQPSSVRQPIYSATGMNGAPSIIFDGVNDLMTSGSVPGIETPNLTYFLVSKRASLSQDMMITASYASAAEKWRTYGNSGSNRIISAHYSPVIKWTRYEGNTSPDFLSYHITPTVQRNYRRGTLVYTRTAGYTVPTGHQNIFLGARTFSPTASYRFTGEISEFILFNTPINSLQRVLIENYLGAKYNLSIADDRYAYEATHRYGLIGIANDGTNIQNTAQGAGVLELSNPLGMSAGEYFLTAHNDFDLSTFNEDDLPASLPEHQRYERTWRVGETGDVGVTSLTFHLGEDGEFGASGTYRLLVDGDGTFTDATIITGVYDAPSHSIRFNVNLSDGQFFTLAGIQEILEIHSVSSGDWSNPLTWDCLCEPGPADLVYIDPLTFVTVDIDASVYYLNVSANAELTMTTDVTLDIKENFDIEGDLTFLDGTVSLTGEVEQNIIISNTDLVADFHDILLDNTSSGDVTFSGGTFSLNGTLSANRGNMVVSAGSPFVIVSTGATTGGRVAPILPTASITGIFSVQRNIPAGIADWRNLASPVLGSTFDDWDPYLAMSGTGFPDGCAFGPDGCFFSVKKTKNGITNDVINSTEPITNGTGFEIYTATDLETFEGTTLVSTGPLNSSEDITFSYGTGWAVAGNPYASPITYSSLTKTSSISNYYYVYDPAIGAYQWYDGETNTASTPEITGDGLIAMGQGFWLLASSAGTVTYKQFDKSDQTATFIRSAATVDESLALKLNETSSTYSCTMFLEELDGMEDGFDETRDIAHLMTGTEKAPSIAVNANDEKIRKNFIKKDGRDKSFDLFTLFKNDGIYTLSLSNWNNFRNYSKILLFDSETGEAVNLKDGDYTFYALADNKNNYSRFTLVLTNSESAGESTFISPNEKVSDGSTYIKQIGNQIDVQTTNDISDELSTVTVTNVLGQNELFSTQINLNLGSNIVTLPNRLSGFYIVTVRTGDKLTTKKIML